MTGWCGVSSTWDLAMADGLTLQDSLGRTFTKAQAELTNWMGDCAAAGRMAPKGSPRSGNSGEVERLDHFTLASQTPTA
jgi:topoisomerase-4 subunit A